MQTSLQSEREQEGSGGSSRRRESSVKAVFSIATGRSSSVRTRGGNNTNSNKDANPNSSTTSSSATDDNELPVLGVRQQVDALRAAEGQARASRASETKFWRWLADSITLTEAAARKKQQQRQQQQQQQRQQEEGEEEEYENATMKINRKDEEEEEKKPLFASVLEEELSKCTEMVGPLEESVQALMAAGMISHEEMQAIAAKVEEEIQAELDEAEAGVASNSFYEHNADNSNSTNTKINTRINTNTRNNNNNNYYYNDDIVSLHSHLHNSSITQASLYRQLQSHWTAPFRGLTSAVQELRQEHRVMMQRAAKAAQPHCPFVFVCK